MRPKCPNHTVEMDKTDNPRLWICPISGATFEAEVDSMESGIKIDKYGRPMKFWKVKDEGQEQ